MPLDRTNPNDFYHKGHKEYLKFRWNETSSKEFLEKAKTGVHENAEDDAIELRQILADYTKLQEILNKL